MTSIVAWERSVGPLSEMVLASDSRLGGGERWDACAKIFDIGRDDSIFAFAGNTWRALPMVFQAVATTRSYNGSILRTLDLPKFARHLESVLNVVLSAASGPASTEPPECEFLLAGWSWKLNGFRIYRYTFDKDAWRFTVKVAPGRLPPSLSGVGRGTNYAVIGDGGRKLTGAMAKAYNQGTITGPLDYYPLEYLYQQTQDGSASEESVGGSVQISKVYKSIRVEHFAVQAPEGLSVSGRPVLPYENLDLRTITRRVDGSWYTEPSVPQTPAQNNNALEALDALDVPYELLGDQ